MANLQPVAPKQPDYKKLLTLLNQSQIQRDNPALYNILEQLLQANFNGQTIINNNITNVAASIVPPTPALTFLYEEINTNLSPYFNLSTTPRQLIAGVSNKIIIPLSFGMEVIATGATGHTSGYTNGNASFGLRMGTSINGALSQTTGPGVTLALNNALGAGITNRAGFTTSFWWFSNTNITSPLPLKGLGLNLTSNLNISDPGGTFVPTVRLYVLYSLISFDLF